MTQLRREGWIHHLARHAVACFLTRGDLWISWEEGLKVQSKSVLLYKRISIVWNKLREETETQKIFFLPQVTVDES